MKQINTYINEKLHLTTKRQYTCQPVNANGLRNIVIDRIKNEGPDCDLNDIDVSKITDMKALFATYVDNIFLNFNGNISLWDVSNVKYMNDMFYNCKEFNCDLSMWDVSNVEKMYYTFYWCKKFNQNLNSWNVSNVNSMKCAFFNCPTTPKWYDKDKWEQ